MAKIEDATWPSWTDVFGQEYGPGDIIAVAVINGRSPQMVFAEVVELRKRDGSGELIVEQEWVPGLNKNGDWTEYHERVEKPSCKVKALPLIDGRGFYRSDTPRVVTYSFPGNIIKCPVTRDQIVTNAERKTAASRAAIVAIRKELG